MKKTIEKRYIPTPQYILSFFDFQINEEENHR